MSADLPYVLWKFSLRKVHLSLYTPSLERDCSEYPISRPESPSVENANMPLHKKILKKFCGGKRYV